ncbi:citramalate synthase [Synechococcales cyanobacterium C]|uniref:Citramalate synthase n=1 Tax=Petrachloros mirabilis ULC683 TaxID=2781853 RepID=A0A8K2A0W6_9CYAN|nr:citramalate synthase [Petrachloros mirabilis]NCJ07367.1 citramalate synthase [Petrachloros mirabilis ULC683]
MDAERLWIYDTTLRDGAQREGLALSVSDKLKIAQHLDQLGIPFIEGGWPGANPKDAQFFEQVRAQPLTQAEVVAFCATRRPGLRAADDPMLQPVLAAQTHWITLFGKSWDLHVTEGLKTTLDQNLGMIEETIQFFRHHQRRVIYDAEHWFDGYRENPEYALATLGTAIAAGAEWLVLCDTNGGTLPHQIAQGVGAVRTWMQSQPQVTKSVQLGIHTHNDGGTAVANAIAAVQEGARMVQGTINGYGERCGNANLCTLIPNLQVKLGYNCVTPAQLATLTSTSRQISEWVNLAPDDHAPFVGLSAFAHKGGIHVSAVQRNPRTYEHLDPEWVGNVRRIVISEQAGLSNVLEKARHFGLTLDKQHPASRAILHRLKQLESEGYQFEAAEASFELLIRAALGQRFDFFTLKGFDVHCRTQLAGEASALDSIALATVKVAVEHQEILTAAEAQGPVSALDAALRKALANFYPVIDQFRLTDYKVRILDSSDGTAAITRVLVESSDGQQRWTTVGVSANIIEASYQAVAEGIEYGLLRQLPEGATTHDALLVAIAHARSCPLMSVDASPAILGL